MYTTVKDGVRNGYTLRFANKWSEPRRFALEVGGVRDASANSEEASLGAHGRLVITVPPDATQEIHLYVTAPRSALTGSGEAITMKATDLANGEAETVSRHFFGP